MLVIYVAFVVSLALKTQCYSVQETLTLRKRMQRLMEKELGKGSLSSFKQVLYFNELEKLGNYSFMNRLNYTDKIVLKPTIEPSISATTVPAVRQYICQGLVVSGSTFI